jgi:hypothetical protein
MRRKPSYYDFCHRYLERKARKKLIVGYVSPHGAVNHFVFMAFRVPE